MPKFSHLVKSTILAMGALAVTGVVTPTIAQAEGTVPIDVWALRTVVNSVAISPDGQHLLVMKTESKDGEHVLEIYNVNDLSKPLRRMNAEPMEFISAQWASNNHIFGTAWQVVRKSVKGPEDDVRSYKIYSYNLKSNKFSEASGSFSLVGLLPKEPNKVLISTGRAVDDGVGVDPFAAFRPRSYYKFNLENGRKELVIKGNEKFPTANFDIDGNPRYTARLEPGSKKFQQFYRRPGEESWTQFGEEYDLDDHENLYRILSGFYGYVGPKADDPSKGYMIESFDEDVASLYEFDFNTGQFGKKIFTAPGGADVIGVRRHSMFWAGNNKVVGVNYPGAKREVHWLDQDEKRLIDKLSANIPNAHQVSISSRSQDGQNMVVFNIGPKDPGSFWLVRGTRMDKLGSRNPLVKPTDLSDVEFIKYAARDGKTIPAYVTKPKGEGPFPLIVLPHGGPHVNEVITYSEWGQFLANNGYMVIQPQYRMSTGWGRDHFDSAYGQHGLAMQDDKDDGALHLVKQGLVDPDRIAMFGWSYGGYAALVAGSREDNIYQCTIAAAAVADPEKVYLKRRPSNPPKALDDWSKRRGTIGINPIKEVDKVNIPVFMIHPNWDRRVLYFNYKDYKSEIEKVVENKSSGNCSGGLSDTECSTTLYRGSKKSKDGVVPAAFDNGSTTSTNPGNAYQAKHRFMTIKGADHFSVTLMYEHQKQLYTELLDFLKNDCGPGGL